MIQKSSYHYDDLLACGRAELFGPGNAQLPLPPMLMFDRIESITDDGGAYGKGQVVAALDVRPDLWFFACHFENDPVMPGCLGVDAMWQLIGFYLGWRGQPGQGRALGSGDIKFNGQITPDNSVITYRIEFKRVIMRKLTIGIADGMVEADGETVYTGKDLRVGLFNAKK